MICKDLEEVRDNIDKIDEEIVRLIAKRSNYVMQAANFKKNRDDVKAPQRVERVIIKVRHLANQNNLEPYLIEKVYREMIDCFVNFELKIKKEE